MKLSKRTQSFLTHMRAPYSPFTVWPFVHTQTSFNAARGFWKTPGRKLFFDCLHIHRKLWLSFTRPFLYCLTFLLCDIFYSSASPKLTANVGQTSLKLGQFFLPFSAGTFCSCPGKVTSNQTRRESTEMFSIFLQLKWNLPSAGS